MFNRFAKASSINLKFFNRETLKGINIKLFKSTNLPHRENYTSPQDAL